MAHGSFTDLRDLRNEPGFTEISNDLGFEVMRGALLAHEARERAEIAQLVAKEKGTYMAKTS